MTENSMTETVNSQCLGLTSNLPNLVLSCLTILKLLSLFLEFNICNLSVYINEPVQRREKCCVDVWM